MLPSKTKISYVLAIISFCVIFHGNVALAQTSAYTPLEPLPCIPANGITPTDCMVAGNKIDFATYFQYIFNLAIAMAAALAVFMIVWGGFTYMTTDSWSGKSAGLEKAKHAVYGLVLILASYLILRTIDPRLVAIPSTLVAPLNISKKYSNDVAKLYRDLATLTNDPQLNTQITQANLSNQQAQQQVDSIDSRIVDYLGLTNTSSEYIDSVCRDEFTDRTAYPEIDTLCAQRQNLVNKVASTTSSLQTVQIEKTISDIVRSCDQDAPVSCYVGKEGEIAAQASAYKRQFTQLQPDQLRHIDSYAVYSQAVIGINRLVADGYIKTLSAGTGGVSIYPDTEKVTQATKQIDALISWYDGTLVKEAGLLARLKNAAVSAKDLIATKSRATQ